MRVSSLKVISAATMTESSFNGFFISVRSFIFDLDLGCWVLSGFRL